MFAGRIRSVKPAAFRDRDLARASPAARWTFAGLLCIADDQGRFEDDPRLIKADVYPLDDILSADVEAHLAELTAAEVVCRYVGEDGRRYGHVPGFRVEGSPFQQRPQKPQPARYPPCPHEHTPTGQGELFGQTSADSGTANGQVRDPSATGIARSSRSSSSCSGSKSAVTGPAADGAPALTVNQRAKILADAYCAAEPMSNFMAVRQVSVKAINAKSWTDDQIRAGLLRLAKAKRTPTIQTLRIELSSGADEPESRDAWSPH